MQDRKKVHSRTLSWAMYDWANSAFATTVMAGFFPIFFKEYWSKGFDSTLTTARLGTILSVASFILACMSPLLGAMADHRGTKKLFTFLFMALGVGSCLILSFVGEGLWLWAALFYGLAMIGFNASCVFYDSLLPSIAPGRSSEKASTLGYSLGYLGGGVLFTLNVLMYQFPHWFGMPNGVTAVKASFATVSVWWAFFSIPLFKNVPEPKGVERASVPLLVLTRESVLTIWNTLKKVRSHRSLMFFLLAYWMYIDGVYTVITMAVDFGISLGFKPGDLITALLIVQFIGFPSTLVFAKFSAKFGSRIPILVCLGVYGVTVVLSSQMTEALHFYFLAMVIGLVQGGVQALSRSLYSQMIPGHASGEYFGLFNLVGKFASIFGPLIVGLGTYLSSSHRTGMMGLLVLFLVGGTLLWQVEDPT